MKAMRLAMVGCLVLGLAGSANADDKKTDKGTNKDKVIGTWEIVKGTIPDGSTVEFTKDGKLTIAIKAEGKTVTMEGTYSVDGDKILLTYKQGNMESKETLRIKTLTDTMLVTLDEKDKTDEFKKKK
jgi:uncharacterized protein (TIGR03066 family)